MRYTIEINVQKPRSKVIELFDDPQNLPKWQKGLVSFEHLSGERGHPGAKSKIRFQMGKRRIDMIETITKRDLPQEFSGTYEADGVWNSMENYFEETATGETRWVSKIEFRATRLPMKLMMFLAPGMFKKQSFSFMKAFKEFAEEGKTVN
jgi:hypothetical protein